jgi:hypothetical protein
VRATSASRLATSPAFAARRAIGVSMKLGGIVLTVMPCGASSIASAFVRPITPPFDAT